MRLEGYDAPDSTHKNETTHIGQSCHDARIDFDTRNVPIVYAIGIEMHERLQNGHTRAGVRKY
jgi:hypothetical protein